jgi:hypothetical protein
MEIMEVYWRFNGDYVTITSLEEFLVPPLKALGEPRYSHGGDHSWRCLRTGELTLGLPWGATSAAINEEETGSNRMIYTVTQYHDIHLQKKQLFLVVQNIWLYHVISSFQNDIT